MADITIGSSTVQDPTFFRYNGVRFGGYTRTKVIEEPVTSGDNRTVKFSRITITVSGWITQSDADGMIDAAPGEPLDALLLKIRQRLQVHGQNLQYQERGFGIDLNVNGPPGPAVLRDVAMGPRAGKFTFFSLGGAPDGCHACGFEWEVSTCIAECSKFQIASGVFLEVSFSINYDVGEDGLCTITYHGNAQIPMSLRADNTLDRNIDSEIPRLIRPVPVGFLRRHSRQISTDRASCTFVITDRQIEVAYPMDVVACEIEHRVRQTRPYAPQWDCSISGTIRLSPTADRFLAWRRFFSIAAQRIAFVRNGNGVPAQTFLGVPIPGDRPAVVLGVVELQENLLKNEARFSVAYKIIKLNINAVVRVSGLWRPIVNNATGIPAGGSSYTTQTWARSLANNAQKFKGISGATFDNSNEVVINICNGPVTSTASIGRVSAQIGNGGNAGAAGEAAEQDELADIELSELAQDPISAATIEALIPAESSWISWECHVEKLTDHKQVRHKPLAGTVKTDKPKIDAFGKVDAVAKATSDPASGWSATVDDITQQIATPSLVLRLKGFSVRVGHRVNAPKVISYGGKPAILKTEWTDESELGVSVGVNLYRTDWDLIYIIPGSPSSNPLPANPMLGTDGGVE